MERFIGGINFPCDKSNLINHARQHGAPDEVLNLMEHFPEKQYGSVIDVSRGVSEAKG